MDKQKTIAREAYLEGVGLHTGNMTRLTFRPAPVGYGIRFVRVDLPERPVIPATYLNVHGNAVRGTTLGDATAQVHTVEHILAACSGLGVDNLEIWMTNNEPPVLDGSAKPFAETLRTTGLVEQDAPREYITLTQPVVYEAGDTKLAAYPSDEFSIDCTIAYKHPALKQQQASVRVTESSFMTEIAAARTFCFDFEIEALKSKGLAKGGDLSNAVVIGLNGIHNPDKKLRFPDEFVRHKMLDLIGDLYLAGRPIKARIEALRCGHNHNIQFVNRIIQSKA